MGTAFRHKRFTHICASLRSFKCGSLLISGTWENRKPIRYFKRQISNKKALA